MDYYLKVFDKVVDKVAVRGLCSMFQKLMKVTFKNLYLVVDCKLQNSSFYLLKFFLYFAFLVILHKFVISTTTFTKHLYFKSLVEHLITNTC